MSLHRLLGLLAVAFRATAGSEAIGVTTDIGESVEILQPQLTLLRPANTTTEVRIYATRCPPVRVI